MTLQTVKLTFIYPDCSEEAVDAQVGLSVLEVAKQHDIPIEGACGGGLACATCHVIVESKENFDALPPAKEEEEDMLDLAFGLEETSRLCCQIIVSNEMDGMRLKVPPGTCNIA
jgi:ferredoxin